MTTRCDQCGAVADQRSRFCEDCGSALVPCQACGSPGRPGKEFCGECGAVLYAIGAAPAPAPPDRAVVIVVQAEPGPQADRTLEGLLAEGGWRLMSPPDRLVVAFPSEGNPQMLFHAAAAASKILAERREVRIGIASGDTATATVEATKLAAAASRGEILVGDRHARRLESSLRIGNPRRLAQTSGGETVAYAVLGSGPRRNARLGTGPRLLSPFVGRKREMADITKAVGRIGRGEGGTLGISGEPGMGKSRLLYEVRTSLDTHAVTYVEGRCVPYARAVPLMPMVDILRDNCGISTEDDDGEVARKVRQSLAELGFGVDDAIYLLRLLGEESSRQALADLSPEAFRVRVFDILTRLTFDGARRRPLIMVIEDLHWIDHTSEELLHGLVAEAPSHPVLILVTYRSDYSPPWHRVSSFAEVTLGALDDDAAEQLVSVGIGTASAQPAIVSAILRQGGGNPLFLEELAFTAREGLHAKGDAIPKQLEDTIRARHERLPEGPRRVLEVAAVLGRRSPADLLNEVAGNLPTFHEDLSLLERHDIIRTEVVQSGEEAVFKHALVQTCAYQSLPEGRRRHWHARIAEAIESRHPSPSHQTAELLAHHWARAERPQHALGYYLRCADLAFETYAHAEAERSLRKAMLQAEALDADQRNEITLRICLKRSYALYFLGRVHESVDLLLARREQADRLADPSLRGEVDFWLAHAHSHLADGQAALEAARAAAAEAERLGAAGLLGRARYVLAREGWWNGRFADGLSAAESAVSLLEESRERWWLGHCLCYLGHLHHSRGEFDHALAAVKRASDLADRCQDPRLQSFALWTRGWYLASIGQPDDGITACERSIACSPDPVNSAWALGFLGYAHREKGNLDRAIDLLRRSIEAVRKSRHDRVECWFEGWLADALLDAGEREDARAVARHALMTARRVSCRWAEASAMRTLGRLAAHEGRLDLAARELEAAASLYRAIDAGFETAVTEADRTELVVMAGREGTASASHEPD